MPEPTPTLLFAYGTLMPDGPETAAREGWVADGVRGRLFDLGPYPALMDLDCNDPTAGWVEGFVRPADPAELNGCLDTYEGVDEGLYRRVATTTRAGRRVWVYVYARPLPASARGPLTRWQRFASAFNLPVKETSDGHLSHPGPDS
jgi:gamma-glutamylcyclotransferase (GGCT)/AIG2-like uncharacterized protein YtfP